MSSNQAAKQKKSYHKPGLRVYGDLQLLTNAVASKSSQPDGGMAGTNKTT